MMRSRRTAVAIITTRPCRMVVIVSPAGVTISKMASLPDHRTAHLHAPVFPLLDHHTDRVSGLKTAYAFYRLRLTAGKAVVVQVAHLSGPAT